MAQSKFAKRVDLKGSQNKQRRKKERTWWLCEVMDMLISLSVVIIICTKHQVVHHKYLQFLFDNYTSIKQKTREKTALKE